MSDASIDTTKVAEFLGLTFGIAWISALALWMAGIGHGTLAGTVLITIFVMWAPAAAAIIVQRRRGASVREKCGLRLGRVAWSAVAWIAPVAFMAAAVGVGLLLPNVSLTTDFSAFLIEQGVPPEQVDAVAEQLEALPVSPVVLFVGAGLAAGLTINALAALGEELGWRGLLLAEWAPLGFWKLSLWTGLVWGFWHTPVILQGHNFPDNPILGIVVMTGAGMAMAPFYTYFALRARSVLAPTFLHGSFNGLGGITIVYLSGAGNLVTAPVGLVGIGAALVITALCVAHDRLVASTPITTGAPLVPWATDTAPTGESS